MVDFFFSCFSCFGFFHARLQFDCSKVVIQETSDAGSPQGHPTPSLTPTTPSTPLQHTHTQTIPTAASLFSTRFQLEHDNSSMTNGPMDGQSLLQSCMSATKKSFKKKNDVERKFQKEKNLVLRYFNFVRKQICVSGALLVREMKFFFQTPFLRASPTTWRSD